MTRLAELLALANRDAAWLARRLGCNVSTTYKLVEGIAQRNPVVEEWLERYAPAMAALDKRYPVPKKWKQSPYDKLPRPAPPQGETRLAELLRELDRKPAWLAARFDTYPSNMRRLVLGLTHRNMVVDLWLERYAAAVAKVEALYPPPENWHAQRGPTKAADVPAAAVKARRQGKPATKPPRRRPVPRADPFCFASATLEA